MERLRSLRPLAIPAAAGLLLAAVALSHRGFVPGTIRKSVTTPQPRETAAPPRPPAPPPRPVTVRPAPPPKPMEGDEARIYTVYQDFRTAVALDHDAHRKALYEVLANNRDAALRLAEADLSAAPDEFSREIALKTISALKR